MGYEVIDTPFPCEKFMSGMCCKGKDGWKVGFVGDEAFSNNPVDSLDASIDDIILADVENRGYSTHVINSKHVIFHLKDTVNNILPPERKGTLEKEVLEQIEEASSKLEAAHASLWIVYEGTIGIQEVFGKVNNASHRLDTIQNKLSVLRDVEELPRMEPVQGKDVDTKLDLTSTDDDNSLKFESVSASPCHMLPHHTGNPNLLDVPCSTKPWAYHVNPFNPSDIPMQLAKRKALYTPMGPVPKHTKLEAS
ncbi:hypothetical protein J3A83DRAFT_4184548 [Scleroderma citrinum]